MVPVFRMTSGARYSGVPHSVYVSPNYISTGSLSTDHDAPTVFNLLGESEVNQLKVSLRIDQNVLWLQVPVCDTLSLMQELEYQHNFSGIKL
jgi:hypothetical protein